MTQRQNPDRPSKGSTNHAGSNSRSRLSRLAPWIALTVVLLAIAWWLVPRRTTEVVSVDGEHRWIHYEAPPQRQVLWTPAERVEDLPLEAGPRDSLIRPALAEGGSLLYFTVRKTGGDLDIYQSRLVDDQWQPAEPVPELNTEHNDIGPVIRADGKELYLYSNRPGGYGKYDIYLCRRIDGRWAEPQNAGPLVNSPANEYDPAAAPGGRQLYYASDRTAEMHDWVAAGKQVDPANEWNTTLRAQRGLIQFDIYQASRDDEDADWRVGRPLPTLNHPTANEGSPFVDPWGAFVYFVSDRPHREGEETNYDILRARIDGELVGMPENLGLGVNTARNEVEPALSPEGYRLLFSRDLEDQGNVSPQDETYALYSSTATEVYAQAIWDDTNLQALLFFLQTWWTELLLLLLTLLVAALIYWLVKQKWVRRMTIPTFLLLALLFHLLFGAGSFFVYLGGDIVEKFKELYVEPEMVTDNLDTGEQTAPEQFEEVADLEAVESVAVESTPRQVVQANNVPVEVESFKPTIPAELARELPPEQLIALPPKLKTPAPTEPQLARRELLTPTEVFEPTLVETEQAQPQESPPNQPQEITSTNVPVERAELTPTEATVPDNLVRKPFSPSAAAELAVDAMVEPVAEPTSQPASAAVANAPTMQRRVTPQAELAQPNQVEVEQVANATGDSFAREVEVGTASVEVNRAEQATSESTVDTVRATIANTAAMKPSATATESLRPSESTAEVTDINFAAEIANPLAGRRTSLPTELAATEVEQAKLPSPAAGTPSEADSDPTTAEVAVQRTNTNAPTDSAVPNRLASATNPPSAGPQLTRNVLKPVLPSAATPTKDSIEVSNPQLNRRRSPAEMAEFADADATPLELAATTGTAGEESAQPEAGLEVGVQRNDAQLSSVTAGTPQELMGPRRPLRHDLTIGRIGPVENNARPTFGPVSGELARRGAVASPLMFAEESVGLAAMFRLRKSDARDTLLKEFGGSDATEEAIRRGLLWIVDHQNGDGSWSLNRFNQECDGHKKCDGHGGIESNPAATGFALLPFLGGGHTHTEGPHMHTVRGGVEWLLKNQKNDGDLSQGSKGNAQLYAHGIATIAMCEAYGMSKDERLAEPARRAVEFIVNSQHQQSGGWRYHPNQSGDTSVVGWQIMALKSAQMAGLEVPERTLELAGKWLDKVEGKGNRQGWFGYTSSNDKNNDPTMTAEGLLCRQYLGAKRDDETLRRGADHLLKYLPQKGKFSSYYWYYGTQCMYHMQGEHWRKWNNATRDLLVESQRRDGNMAGTWDPKDNWEKQGGRIMSTSLRLLMLEVYYRHLPLYQVLDE